MRRTTAARRRGGFRAVCEALEARTLLDGAPTPPAARATPPAIGGVTPDTGTAGDGVTREARALVGTTVPRGRITLFEQPTRGPSRALGSAVADAAGRWQVTPRAPLAEGTHRVFARLAPAPGRPGATGATFTVVVDRQAPPAPAFAAVLDRLGPNATFRTLDERVGLRGTAEPGAVVTITVDGRSPRRVVADARGSWTLAEVGPIAVGGHALAAVAADRAGNASRTAAATLRRDAIDLLGPPLPVRPDALTFRVLLLIKPEVDVTLPDGTRVTVTMSDQVIRDAGVAVSRVTDNMARELSGGRIRLETTVVVSDTPLTRVSTMGAGYTVAPDDVREDFDRYIPEPGRYDSVLVFADLRDEADGDIVPMEAYGLAWGLQPAAKFATYAMIQYIEWDALLRPGEPWGNEVFLHEWLHGLEAFYSERGLRMPTDGLHGAEEHGMPEADPVWGWSPWYRQFLTGTAIEPDGAATGLGPRAWRLGTVRDYYRPLAPGFVTPAMAARNLLQNADAEASGLAPWRAYGWRPDGFAADRAGAADARRGAGALRIRNDAANDVRLAQDVAVTPGHDYLLAGWIRTEGVRVLESGEVGANLSVEGTWERTPGVAGDSGGWRYVALRFGARDRRQVTIAARLGFFNSTATGSAWFDDLLLLDLGPTPTA
jgi:hypothetical protein